MAKLARLLVIVSTLAGAASAAAQSSPPEQRSSDDAIVVTGRAEQEPSRAEVFNQALEVSRLDPHKLYDRPVPRFAEPICPGVFGIREDYAAEIISRVRANAKRLKVKLAKQGCTPNLMVAFLDDGREFLAHLAERQPRMFQLLGESEREELLAPPAPVRVWNNMRTIDLKYGPVPIRNGKEVMPSFGNTVMYLPMVKVIFWSLVVFDPDATTGLTLNQVADYATMRGLSNTRPVAGDERLDTILSMFGDDGPNADAPGELTRFDVGYLSSLYFDRPNGRAVSRLLGVRSRAAREESRAAQ